MVWVVALITAAVLCMATLYALCWVAAEADRRNEEAYRAMRAERGEGESAAGQ